MTKWGFRARFKAAIWAFYSDELWTHWRIVPAKDRGFLEQYQSDVEQEIRRLPQASRDIVKNILELVGMYKIRQGASSVDGTAKKFIWNVRLFEDIHLKQRIERVEKLEALEKAEAAKKLRKLAEQNKTKPVA